MKFIDPNSKDNDVLQLSRNEWVSEKNLNTSILLSDILNMEHDILKENQDCNNNSEKVINDILKGNFVTYEDNEPNEDTRQEPINYKESEKNYVQKPFFNSTPLSEKQLKKVEDHEFCERDKPRTNISDLSSILQNEVRFGNETVTETIVRSLEVSNHENILMEFKHKIFNKKPAAAKGFYFQPYPEQKILNERKSSCNRGFFLKNGLLLSLQVHNGQKVLVKNTCGFDAIMHLLQFSALDNPAYFKFIEDSSNPSCRFLNNFITKGPCKDVYTQRCNILKKFYPVQKDAGAPILAPWYLDATDYIYKIWKNLFSLHPSATIPKECNNSDCPIQKIEIASLGVNHNTVSAKGFEALEESLQHYTRIKNQICPRKQCGGTVRGSITFNIHLFIELDVRGCREENKYNNFDNQEIEKGKDCRLEQFPTTLDLGRKYR